MIQNKKKQSLILKQYRLKKICKRYFKIKSCSRFIFRAETFYKSVVLAGYTQINKRTDYVKHMHNGYIIDDISQTVESLDYFLAFKNWNYSYAYSMRLTDDFSSINIIHQINQLFKVMFQVARKFRVLQVGGHDLGSLFNQKVMSNGIILMLVCLILKVAIKML